MNLACGKLPSDVLAALLGAVKQRDSSVLVGPSIGEDAAVLDMGDRCLVVATDPVTFATDEIGWYAVHVNANDVACTGARPQWFLSTLLLPTHLASEQLARTIFEQIGETCDALNVAVVGGHTEVTDSVIRPIVVGQMLGSVARDRYVRTGGAKVGDAIILTKSAAIEGSAILAREKSDQLVGVLSGEEISRAARMIYEPGISVVEDVELSLRAASVHAMHDPTEGGVATALHELADASDVGLEILESEILVDPISRRICDHFQLDPLGTISSGALIVTVAQSEALAVIERLEAANIRARVIGKVVDGKARRVLLDSEGTGRDLPRFDQDEITRAL